MAVAAALPVARIDLGAIDASSLESTTSFVARGPARALGLLLYFEADLAPGIAISTAPSAAADDNHWTCRVFRANARPNVAAGETVRVEFSVVAGASAVPAI